MIYATPVEILVFVLASLGFIAMMPRPRTPRQKALSVILFVFVIGPSVIIGNRLIHIAVNIVQSAPYLCLVVSVTLFGFIEVIARKRSA